MNLKELAEDLWGRFCKLDDNMQVIWMEEYAERPLRIMLKKDINKYFDEKFHGDYVGFYQMLKKYDEWVDEALNKDKKWFMDNISSGVMDAYNTLASVALNNTNLLAHLDENAFCKTLGYKDKEIQDIQNLLKTSSKEEVKAAWIEVMTEIVDREDSV